jgi:hypothetical protein
MDYRKKFLVEPGAKVHLLKIDPSYTGKHETHEAAATEIGVHIERMDKRRARGMRGTPKTLHIF